MARAKLTTGRVRDFQLPADKAQAFLRDTEAPGLAVRATIGTKAFIFQGKLKDGSTLRRTIGDVRAWNIEEARLEARRLHILIDQGTDPRELDREKAEAKSAAIAANEAVKRETENRQRYTLRTLCDEYIALLKTKGKMQSARQTSSIFKCHIYEQYPEIANTPAREVKPLQIAAMVRKVAEKGKDRAAGILRSYLSAAFNAARKAPFDAKLPSSLIAYEIESNPVDPVSTIAVQRGNRTLSDAELREFMAGMTDDLSDIALKLALFSGGQRMAQLLRAKISDYDPQTHTLRLLDGKGKRTTPREHMLPLAPKAAAMVAKLIARAGSLKTPLLFSSSGTTQMVETTPGKRAKVICKSMKCDLSFNLRDIRRTCETMLAALGISKDTRAQLLSHGLSGVQTAHYDRHDYIIEKRTALVAWETRLDEIAIGKKSRNVVQLKRKALN